MSHPRFSIFSHVYIDINKVLTDFNAKTDEQIIFIQIGANDGTKKDHIVDFIKNHNWYGILVEPVSFLFDKLKITYADYNLRFENSAITSHDGQQTIYRLPNNIPALPEWHDGLASLNKDVIISHSDQIPGIESLLVEETIQTLTFSSLLTKHGIKKIDVLHIDTEGHDFEIIKTIDFNDVRPTLIIYEYFHLTLYNYDQSGNYLRSKGYEVLPSHDSFDMIAIDKLIIPDYLDKPDSAESYLVVPIDGKPFPGY